MTEVMTIINELSFDDSITKIELFDIDRMQFLLRSNTISKLDKMSIQKYYKRKQNLNNVSVTYQLGIKSKTYEESGRLVVGKGGIGLQSFSREIRNFLAEKYYWDIDIVNAQPTILWQYADRNGWKCDAIKKFCDSRDEIIEGMINDGLNRDESKNRLIQLFFGSDYIDGLSDFIKNELYPELKKIRQNISQNHQKLYIKLSKRPNPSASVMALVLQTEERYCMRKIEEMCEINKRSFDVFMHDGGYIRKEQHETCLPKELIKKCEEHVLEKLGYKLSIIQKPITSSIIMEDNDLLDENTLVNDMYAAKQCIELMGDDIIYDNGILYVYIDGIWTNDEEYLNTCISNLNDKLVFKKIGGISGIITYDYSGSIKNRENMKRMIPSLIEKKEGFLDIGRQKATGKLLFKNGIYDFKSNTLNTFDRSIVFSAMIPFDFSEGKDQEAIDFVQKTFFQDAFNNEEIPTIFRHFLMRGIIGDYQVKKFLTCIGPTNCGKGMLQEFMGNIFGRNIGNFNCNSLIARSNTEGTRDLGWFTELANTRICFGSEIKTDKNSKIDSEMIKQIVSGGEKIVARKLFKDEQVIIPRTMPILMVNEMSAFSSMNDAILNRLIPIQYNYSFVEFPDENKPYQKKAKSKLKNELRDEKYKKAMILLLIQEYKTWQTNEYKELELPENMVDFKEDIISIVNIEDVLDDIFIITKDMNDYITVKDLETTLSDKKSTIFKNVATVQLELLGCKRGRLQIDKRQTRVIYGIKPI